MTVDRTRLPALAPTRPFAFPPLAKSTLSNGLAVWSVEHRTLPVVTIGLLMRRGAASDPPGKAGLAALTADMLDEGSGGRSTIGMHEALARLGAQFDTEVGPDATVLTLTILRRFAEQGLVLLGEMVTQPTFAEVDFERVRQLRRHRLLQLRDVPSVVAERAFLKLLFGRLPYGHLPIGEEASLEAMAVEDVRQFHREVLTPSDATLIVVGDCDHPSAERMATAALASWRGRGAPLGESRESEALPELPTPDHLNVIVRPGAPQSEIRIGHVTASRSIPDYHALVVLNMILGGQFVSRINLNLRQDKGMTYGARTVFDLRRHPGPFALQVSVDPAAGARAIAESLRELAAIRGAKPATSDELALAIAGLTRGFPRSFETADQIARAAAQMALYELPDDYFDTFVPRIEQIDVAEVTRVAERYLEPPRMTTLLVGDFERVRGELGQLALGEPHLLQPEMS